MSIVSEPLCRAKVCPFPSSPEWHVCIVCGALAVEHHHVDSRGSGGSPSRDNPENIVMLCRPHHDEVSLNKVRDKIDVRPVGRYYIRFSGKFGESVKAFPVPSDGGEAVRREPDHGADSSSSPSAGDPGAVIGGRGRQLHSGSSSLPPPATFTDNGIRFEAEVTFEEWAKIAAKVRGETVGRQFRLGDLVNAGEALGERCWQYLDDVGLPVETLSNYANVSKAFPIEERRSVPFTYHQSVWKHPERFELLDRCMAEGWDRSALREAAGLRKSERARKFTLAELRELAVQYDNEHANLYSEAEPFVTWLEGR